MLELKIGLFLVFSLLVVSGAGAAKSDDDPEQIHIAYGEDPTTSMYVVWNTASNTSKPMVKYYADGEAMVVAEGVSRKFEDGGSEHRVQYINRVKVTGLTPGRKYYYICGTNHSWSDKFAFTAMKSGSDWSPSLVVYGDLGNTNAQSLPRLLTETKQGMYDAALHIGDFAYDMYKDNARVGDSFMRQIQPVAATLPYMTCPGNHENSYNFSNYRHRFVMPGDELSDRMYFSFNMGPAHIISLNTEYYFYLQYGADLAMVQYKWLEQDLQEAAKPENRAKRPWIITMGHRPMYCSNSDRDDCTKDESIVRTGISSRSIPGLEDLFYKYGVDLQLWAHEHSYERLWPLYNRTMYNGSNSEPYTNPGAPVHIITGSAGCSENHDPFANTEPSWSAYRSDDYGYTRMTIHNATHLYMEQVSDDKDGKIIDRMWLRRDVHGPFPPRK